MTGPEGVAGSVPTVGALLERRALLDRDTPALIAGSLRLSFGQLQAWAETVAEAFAAAGVRKGDRVAVLSRNSAEGVALYYGAARGGAILCNLNIRLTEVELARILSDAEPALLVAHPDFADLALSLAARLGIGRVWRFDAAPMPPPPERGSETRAATRRRDRRRDCLRAVAGRRCRSAVAGLYLGHDRPAERRRDDPCRHGLGVGDDGL